MTPHTLAALILATAASALAAPPAILSVRQALPEGASPADRALPVGRYEKVELRVDVQAAFENPYDPDDVDVGAEFTAPSGRVWKIWAFYLRPDRDRYIDRKSTRLNSSHLGISYAV